MRRFLGLLLPLAALGCSSGGETLTGVSQMVGPGGGQVVSADGDLTLDIPAGALPADTEITVRNLDPAAVGAGFPGLEVAGAYEFGPDGLVFQQPVTVTLRLDQVPVGPGGVLQAEVVSLFSDSGTGPELADAQEIRADAETGATTLTAQIAHFSNLVKVKAGIKVEVSGVPDTLVVGKIFNVEVSVSVAPNIGPGKATLTTWGNLATYPDPPTEPGVRFDLTSQTTATYAQGPFGCDEVGKGEFAAEVFFEDVTYNVGAGAVEVIGESRVYVTKPILHKQSGDPRLYKLSLAALEAASSILFPFPELSPKAQRAVTVGGDGAWAIVDTDTGDELVHVATPAGTTYGAILLADSGVFAVFAYGTWGAAVWYWQGSAFGAAVILSSNHITDAVAVPGGGAMFSDFTAGKIWFLQLVANAYVVSAIFMNLPGVISATQLPDGSILAVTGGMGGGLYAAASRDGTLLLVGLIADSLRRVRALGNVAAISYYGGGVAFGGISVAARTNGVWALVFGLIGTSSIGIDLKQPMSDFQRAAVSDHIFIAATSYLTNEYRVIEVEADGNYWADTLVAMPEGCEAPGHALWLPGTNELVITCHDSDTLAAIPVE